LEAHLHRGLRGSFWPSHLQERLLVVVLGDPEESAAAWQAIRPEFVLDDLEPGAFELMPFVYSRLAETLPDDALLERLKGVYRREWVRSSVLAERTKEVSATLREASVDALFIEGAVLAHRYYPSPALRTSWFLDALVEPRDANRAAAALAAGGWSAPAPAGPPRERLPLTAPDRTVCVVRTAPAYDFVDRAQPDQANAPLWEGAETYELAGSQIATTRPTETLLAVCVAGARVQEPPSLTWLVDAAMIIRAGAVDWSRLAAAGCARAQAPRLHDALAYLSRLPGVAGPAETVRELATAGVTTRERLVHALTTGRLRSAGGLPEIGARHLSATAHMSARRAALSFPGRLRAEWGTRRAWQLPAAAVRRVARRLRVPLA
jgi:hypothetical protein